MANWSMVASRALASPPILAVPLLLAASLLAPLMPARAQAPQQRPPAQHQAPAAKTAPAASGDSGLRQRVEQLEEQLVDMQVVIGTLESLARGGGAPAAGRPSPAASAGVDAAEAGRLDSLETQIRAMAAQLEQMQEQLRAMSVGRGGAVVPQGGPATAEGPTPRPPVESASARPGFGAPVVTPAERGGGQQVASAPPVGGPGESGDPKQAYETAYGYLLQRDYGAAEAAFDDFLRRNPGDPLAGNAQYWLGETYYVRGQYRAAANAFLKGYQTYGRSSKAPESLLKLAMSLQRLGQKDAACSSYSELGAKYPSAPQHVKNTALAERQRAGC